MSATLVVISGSSSPTFLEATAPELGLGCVLVPPQPTWGQLRETAERALDGVMEKGSHPVLAGHGHGGSLALLLAAERQDVQGVIGLSAPSDFLRLVEPVKAHAPSRYQRWLDTFGSTPQADPGLFRAASPIFATRRIQSPVLLVHGTADLIVPVEHTLWLYASLIHVGHSNVTMELVPTAGHYFERGLDGLQTARVAGRVGSWMAEIGRLTA